MIFQSNLFFVLSFIQVFCIALISYDTFQFFLLTITFTVVSQYYLSEAENEYVIRGNSVILKCKIPSFVADFVTVEAWLDEDGNEFNNTVNGDIS